MRPPYPVIGAGHGMNLGIPPQTQPKTASQMKSDYKLAGSNGTREISAAIAWNLEKLHSKDYNGSGITIAVMDTEVNIEHAAFKRCDSSGQNQSESIVKDGANYLSTETDQWKTALDSHGTMVAFIASGRELCKTDGTKYCGVAPGAKLLICRVAENDSRIYSNQALISALKKLLNNQRIVKSTNLKESYVDIISMSFGCDYDIHNAEQEQIKILIDDLTEWGVICIAASGNFGNFKDVHFPACLSSVISVGALNDCGYRSDSSPSKDIDVFAPGEGIMCPSVNSPSGMILCSGSSCATPAIAGLVALLLQYANGANDDLKRKEFRDVHNLRTNILGKQMKQEDKFKLFSL